MTKEDPEREIAHRIQLAGAGPRSSGFSPLVPVLLAALLVGFVLAWS